MIMMGSDLFDPYILLCIIAGIIISFIVIILLNQWSKLRNEAFKDYIKAKDWKVVSVTEDPVFIINVKGKSEGLYYIKYLDKDGKLHDCVMHIDFSENRNKILKDVIVG